MGQQSQVKAFRKQIKNVITGDFLGQALGTEAYAATAKELKEHMKTYVGEIGAKIDAEFKRMDKQTEMFREYVLNEIAQTAASEFSNMAVTLSAYQTILAKKLGVDDFLDFDQQVLAEKNRLFAKLKAEAQAQADAETAAKKAEELEANAATSALAESPAEAIITPV